MRSIQSTLTDAVRQVSDEDCEIIGASRTDSGAHARGQVCVFDTVRGIEPWKWTRVLNQVLPVDVAVVRSGEAPREFHPRFWAIDRWYRYRVLMGTPDPLRSRYAHRVWQILDVDAMHQAAQRLVGRHDFRAFSEELPATANAVRRLFRVEVVRRGREAHIDIVGTAFLRGMMRRISGALVEIGRGYREESEIDALLDARTRDEIQWPVVLPARGLTLMRIRHGKNSVLERKELDDFGDPREAEDSEE